MDIAGSVALVTGANRGLGLRFVDALLDRGAATVYAAARRPESITARPGVVPLRIDVTDPASVEEAAARASDVTLLVNNAGSATGAGLLDGTLDDLHTEMDTHYFGTLAMSRAFAPILDANGGGAILNVLSALSWVSLPQIGGYSAAKSAQWSLTNGLRATLAPRTLVTALHVGYMDTDMAKSVDGPKIDPAVVAQLALDGIEAGAFEVLADDTATMVKSALSGPVAALYPELAAV